MTDVTGTPISIFSMLKPENSDDLMAGKDPRPPKDYDDFNDTEKSDLPPKSQDKNQTVTANPNKPAGQM